MQKFINKFPLSLVNKKLLSAQFLVKICYVACAINRTGKFICLHACLHESDHVGLVLSDQLYTGYCNVLCFTEAHPKHKLLRNVAKDM